jgi:hypothetical protein
MTASPEQVEAFTKKSVAEVAQLPMVRDRSVFVACFLRSLQRWLKLYMRRFFQRWHGVTQAIKDQGSSDFVGVLIARATELKNKLDAKCLQLEASEKQLKKVATFLLNRTICSAQRACAGSRFNAWKQRILEQKKLFQLQSIIHLKSKRRQFQIWQYYIKLGKMVRKVVASMLKGSVLPFFNRSDMS